MQGSVRIRYGGSAREYVTRKKANTVVAGAEVIAMGRDGSPTGSVIVTSSRFGRLGS